MARGTYFYDQKRTVRPKRYRKVPDEASVAGDRGYPIRKILSRVSSASGESSFRRPKSALKAPSLDRYPLNEVPPTSPSKPKSLAFPQIDSGSGKKRSVSHLDPSEASWITPGKEKLLHSIEEEDKGQDRSLKFFSNFDEAKFAATGILSQLVKVLESKGALEEVELPTELIGNLRKDFEDLSEDVVVEKRTWQTDCYLDWETESRHPFFEGPPEDRDLVCSALHNSVNILITKQQQQKKRVKMASQYGPDGKRGSMSARKGSASRPVSSMSIHSDALGSEFMFGESVAETDDGFDFLPPGLGVRTPTTPLLQYRGEMLAANYEDMKSPTRLEKNEKMKRATKKINVFRKKKTVKEKDVVKEEEAFDDPQKRASTATIIKRGETVIPFAMSRSECEELGWLVEPDDKHDPEGVTLLKWIQARLKAVIKQKNEDKFTAHLRGEDGPLTLRYYNDMHHRSHHSRPRVPQAHITIPLPPGVEPGATAMRVSVPSSELPSDDQRKKFITILPDGSGALYYRSGRPAIVLSRKGDGTRDLLTFAFSDSIPQRMLAYFSSGGRMCCYHPNGELHMLSDKNGGTLYNEDGYTVRQWIWPEPHYKLPVSIAITLNDSLSFRCTSLNFAFLYFTSGSVNHKMSVAPPLDSRTTAGGVDGDEVGTLMSTAPFSSNTAFSLLPSMDNKSRQSQLKTLKSVDLDSSSQLDNEDELSIELRSYKTRVKCTVDEWLSHYRRLLGINTRMPSPLANSRTSFTFSSGPPSRLQSSRAQPRPQSHTRHKTHPLPGSRPASQLSALSQSPPCSPTPALGTSNVGLVYDRPASRVKYHTVQNPVQITASMRGVDRGLNAKKLGCPVALRAMIKMKHSAPPPCKCDKRHIPPITDVEYDRYLQTHVPKDQLVVVCVNSDSLLPKPGAGGGMGTFTTLYTRLNKNRTSPCERSAMDPYRIVCYDLSTAAQGGKEGEPPLLVSRHGIAANMVLVYWNAKLVFAGDRFNGYGMALKDFTREVENIKRKIAKDQFLPKDFKFRSVLEVEPVGVTTAQSVSEFSDDMLSLSASGLWASQSSITKLHASMTGQEGVFLKYSKPES